MVIITIELILTFLLICSLKKYCEKEAANDPMLNKIPQSSNPFRERKKVCNLI